VTLKRRDVPGNGGRRGIELVCRGHQAAGIDDGDIGLKRLNQIHWAGILVNFATINLP